MGKIYMNDLADLLAQKANISKREAQQFIAAVIETIQDGVNDDKQVKIKGLGTFKVIDIDARESVNVNTGERVTIDSHQKLTFTPDTVMKELVNRPFSQFETVVLNEGVEFDDDFLVKELTIEANETLPIIDEEKNPVIEPAVEVQETIPVIEEQEEEPVAEEQEEEENMTEEEKNVEKEEEKNVEKEESESYWWAWLLLAIAACVASFAGGYLYGRHMDRMSLLEEEGVIDTTSVVAPVKVDTIKKDTLEVDTATLIKQDTTKIEVTTAPKVKVPEIKAEVEPEWKKYEKQDARVRTGAYAIIGTERTEKVRQGDTTKRIAKRTLGDGMECYIQAYNNIDEVTEGMKLKIPQLKLKFF